MKTFVGVLFATLLQLPLWVSAGEIQSPTCPTEYSTIADCKKCLKQVRSTGRRLDHTVMYVSTTKDMIAGEILMLNREYQLWLEEALWRCFDKDMIDVGATINEIQRSLFFSLHLMQTLAGCQSKRGCDAYWR